MTVNSDTNYLRWNQNLIDEKSRIHGILYRSFRKSWSSIGTKLVGLDNEYLSYDNSKWFYNNMSKAKNIDQLKGLKLNSSGTEYYIKFNLTIYESISFVAFIRFVKFSSEKFP